MNHGTKKKSSLRVKIPEYKPNNNNHTVNKKTVNKKTAAANVNRSNVPNNLKKNCYNKGISLYKLNNNKVSKKNVSVLKSQCASKNTKNTNANVKRYGVPPKPERVLAIMQLNNSKPSFKNAVRFANDPFYNFGNPVYLPVSPIPYSRKTWPTKKQHTVYTILPNYFPGKHS
jgi:hypothetical protein